MLSIIILQFVICKNPTDSTTSCQWQSDHWGFPSERLHGRGS